VVVVVINSIVVLVVGASKTSGNSVIPLCGALSARRLSFIIITKYRTGKRGGRRPRIVRGGVLCAAYSNSSLRQNAHTQTHSRIRDLYKYIYV